jgi:hypothetical protein
MTTHAFARFGLAALLTLPARLAAQAHDHHDVPAADAAMTDDVTAGLHRIVSPVQPPAPGDSARAADLVATLRAATAKYRDVRVAEADGYRVFAPKLRPRVYHYTNRRDARRSMLAFDPAHPASLLYRPRADGTLELVGAMYTAPGDATLEELDARIPLSVARWHKHVNVCLPRWGERERLAERRDGRAVFGGASPIATREACEAIGGRFRGGGRMWMVHVNAFAGDDPATIWGDEHDHAARAGSARASRGSSPVP